MSATYCRAAPSHPLHGPYHDQEYGFPAEDESLLFERLVLEINQAGLSWLTVLQKREAFRAAFANYKVDRVAAFDERDVARLLADAGIVRNRLKVAAVIDNARAIQQLRQIAWLVPRLAGGASSAAARGMDALVPPHVSLHRRLDRPGIPVEPRLSARGARAGLPGLRSHPSACAAMVAHASRKLTLWSRLR